MERRTERLRLVILHPGLAEPMVHFMRSNEAHFAPWDPPWPEQILETAWWQEHAAQALAAFDAQRAAHFVLLDGTEDRVLGIMNFSQVHRGPFQACFLGYKIAAEAQGKGLMREGLRAGIDFMWEEWNLHRIHANYMPGNIRSGRLLARLGFVIEGYARDYLYINGAWRDHILTSLTRRAWPVPAAWRRASADEA